MSAKSKSLSLLATGTLWASAMAVQAAVPAAPVATTMSGHIVAADLGRGSGPMNRMADRCVGAGRANEGCRANDVQSAWRDLGSPAQLTRAQVEILRRASAGTPVIEAPVDVGADGAFARSFPMRENDVWSVELRPL